MYNTYKDFLAAREARLAGMVGSASSSARGWEEAPTTVEVLLPEIQQEGYLGLDEMDAAVAP